MEIKSPSAIFKISKRDCRATIDLNKNESDGVIFTANA